MIQTSVNGILALITVLLLLSILYLISGWKNAVERKIEALEKQLDDIQQEIMYIRRGMP